MYDFPVGLGLDTGEIANMVYFIAVSEDGWTSLKEMEEKEKALGGPTVPLMERVDATITLEVFNQEITRDLIEKRLSYNRIEGKFQDKPLIPFDEKFVEYIYETTRGEPRDILTACSHVLDEGLSEKIPLLTKEFAEKALKEHGF